MSPIIRSVVKVRFPRLYRLLSLIWQLVGHYLWLVRRLLLCFRPVTVPVGSVSIFLKPVGHVAETIWRYGFEEDEQKFVRNYLKPGMCVLNIGANIGLYTLIAAKIVGSSGSVHAFEPATLNYGRLKRNLNLNMLTNVVTNQMAISDFHGELDIMSDPEHPDLDSHYFAQRNGEGFRLGGQIESMICDTLDNYWLGYCDGLQKQIDMIIIDVEGGELEVLNGAQSILRDSSRLVMMIECTNKLDQIDILLQSHGFEYFWINPETCSLERTSLRRGNIFASKGVAMT